MTNKYDFLTSRVEMALAPNREIDACVCAIFHDTSEPADEFEFRVLPPSSKFSDWGVAYTSVDGSIIRTHTPPPYSASLDACVSLLERKLPGWNWLVEFDSNDSTFRATVRKRPISLQAYAFLPAVALLSAIIKARGAEHDTPLLSPHHSNSSPACG